MSRSRKDVWGDPIEFEGATSLSDKWEPYTDEVNEEVTPGKYLDEAHEALSRLVNKTSKRGKSLRASKRGEAWH